MSYKIAFRWGVVEVDSEREFKFALETLGVLTGQVTAPLDVAQSGNGAQNGAKPYRQFYRKLSPNQRQVIDVLADDDWVRDQDVVDAIGAESTLTLAGLWSGIIRNAKAYKLTTDAIFEKEHRKETGGGRRYWYRLTDECREGIVAT